ncbi:hypothetical protein VKT23_007867 [Stygiomarasmius scandens]|uniref:Uncharacterized protein n=1 Tax=Marasmiellus scandens TaxID=2682957 RepID=A0ABR1JJJ8_9AGAR
MGTRSKISSVLVPRCLSQLDDDGIAGYSLQENPASLRIIRLDSSEGWSERGSCYESEWCWDWDGVTSASVVSAFPDGIGAIFSTTSADMGARVCVRSFFLSQAQAGAASPRNRKSILDKNKPKLVFRDIIQELSVGKGSVSSLCGTREEGGSVGRIMDMISLKTFLASGCGGTRN